MLEKQHLPRSFSIYVRMARLEDTEIARWYIISENHMKRNEVNSTWFPRMCISEAYIHHQSIFLSVNVNYLGLLFKLHLASPTMKTR